MAGGGIDGEVARGGEGGLGIGRRRCWAGSGGGGEVEGGGGEVESGGGRRQ